MDGSATYILGTWVLDPLYYPTIVLLGLVWLVMATTAALRSRSMEKTGRLAQLYGYTVCLISLITVLFTVPSLIDTFFQLADPLRAESRFGPALSSFDAYRATHERSTSSENSQAQPGARPDEQELRRQYEALRRERIEANTFEGRRSLIRQLLLLALAIGLFYGHWRWLRRQSLEAGA